MQLNRRLILLDLDGPVLDVSPRYHRLHRELVTAAGGTPLSAGDYWALKRARAPEREILERTGLSPAARAEVAQKRLELIETEGYLEHDRLWPWALRALAELGALAPLVLLTQRSDPRLLTWQLERLGLSPLFTQVLSGREDESELAKANRVRRAGLDVGQGSVLVGDTEVDIVSGKELGVLTVAVRTGIRDDASLAARQPDALLDSLDHVPGWLRERGWGPK